MASEMHNKTTSSEMNKKSSVVELIKCNNKTKNSVINHNSANSTNNKMKNKTSVDSDEITTATTSGDNKSNAIPLKRKNNTNLNNKLVMVKKQNEDSCASEHKTTSKRFKVDEKTQICDGLGIKATTTTTAHSHSLNPDIKVLSKPPLPPKPDKSVLAQLPQHKHINCNSNNANQLKMIKRKHEDNKKLIVQKLSAQTDQLRLEITELKAELANEKNAVRALRAQTEADLRKSKGEIKKLQDENQHLKKSKVLIMHQKKPSQGPTTTATAATNTSAHQHEVTLQTELSRLYQEIAQLREDYTTLEDKYQKSSELDKKTDTSTDTNELNEIYEKRLTQISESAKNEIQRMLEELKQKDSKIEQLRSHIQMLSHDRDMYCNDVKFLQKMRKLEDTEPIAEQRNYSTSPSSYINNENNLNNCSNKNSSLSTCGNEYNTSMPHELFERTKMEAHINLSSFNKENIMTISDSDSALSSAPTSLSPQPLCTNSMELWQLSSSTDECENLKAELELAREHIKELEKLKKMLCDNNDVQKLNDKIKILEHKEMNLIQEGHELREQNELLEFRILELEESHDKWSLRSNSTPDTKDVWTDTEKENDEMLLMSERSDSGVTSPNNSHHHLDDNHSVSPCDLSLMDQIPTDEVRKRILTMSKRSCYDEEDKACLMQVMSLLNNLEALSQDQEMSSLDSNGNKYKSMDVTDSPQFRASATASKNHGKIVATIQPYSSGLITMYSEEAKGKPAVATPKMTKSWTSNSLQESGVFDESLDDVLTQSTQTEFDEFPCLDKTNAELCAEIEKLNKFREKVEECSAVKNEKKGPINKFGVVNVLASESCDKQRLEYYKERLSLLENKILVYESSGDQQIRRLADRLQREIQLDSLVKQLTERVEKMSRENQLLDEERCEFEEAENDTRLRLQRMEIELEIMNQRNIELEISKTSYQAKYHDAKENIECLEDCLHKCEEKIFVLEESEVELKTRIDQLNGFIPLIALYQAWKTKQDRANSPSTLQLHDFPVDNEISSSSTNDEATVIVVDEVKEPVPDSDTELSSAQLQLRINDLLKRENDLTQKIEELNRAYNETLENADNLWAQMEKEYKDKISKCEAIESNLRSKIAQLEDRLKNDSDFAHERIATLEETEKDLQYRITKLTKDNKELQLKHNTLQEEYIRFKEDYGKMQSYLKGPAVDNLEKEKKKLRTLEEELKLSSKMILELEEAHTMEINMLKNNLIKSRKELKHSEVTNSELKEEVETLEERIKELEHLRKFDEEKFKIISDELQNKQSQLQLLQQTQRNSSINLAQELERTSRGLCSLPGIDLYDNVEERPPKEFKSLADSVISNAESRMNRAPKKSFVEEARSRFSKWV